MAHSPAVVIKADGQGVGMSVAVVTVVGNEQNGIRVAVVAQALSLIYSGRFGKPTELSTVSPVATYSTRNFLPPLA